MRLVTVTSIAALVVSIAVLVFVLGLYAELEKSEPTGAIGNHPPSSEEICLSAAKVGWKMGAESALEYRLAVLETQLAHACYK